RLRRNGPDRRTTKDTQKLPPPHERPPEKASYVLTLTCWKGIGLPPCPLWVKSRHVQRTRRCPLYSRKRTCAGQKQMSPLGKKRTSALLNTAQTREFRPKTAPCLDSQPSPSDLLFRFDGNNESPPDAAAETSCDRCWRERSLPPRHAPPSFPHGSRKLF